MSSTQKWMLVVAGEPSGDQVAAPWIHALKELGYTLKGCGGQAMAQAGLESLLKEDEWNRLAVAGFTDVWKELGLLRKIYRLLLSYIKNPACQGLFCIDYPGLNLKLMKQARRLRKPIYWLAPPQIWAWKTRRGQQFREIPVALFFPHEEALYRDYHAHVSRVEHPMLAPARAFLSRQRAQPSEPRNTWILMPGSRPAVARRNRPLYEKIAQGLMEQNPGTRCEWISVQQSRIQGSDLWQRARGLVCPPGTASLQGAVHGIPVWVLTQVDWLTYALGKKFLQTPWLALGNILLQRKVIHESIFVWGLRNTFELQQGMRYLSQACRDEWVQIAEELQCLMQGAEPRSVLQNWLDPSDSHSNKGL